MGGKKSKTVFSTTRNGNIIVCGMIYFFVREIQAYTI
jgi:hypothetical protein